MRITRSISGPVDTVVNALTGTKGEKIEAIYVAGAAIVVGAPVVPDTTVAAASRSKTVITSTVALSSNLVGVYNGNGGSGVPTAVLLVDAATVGTGRVAALNDLIWVTIYGEEFAIVSGNTTNVVVGNPLTCTAADAVGEFSQPVATDLTAFVTTAKGTLSGYVFPVLSMEAITEATSRLCRVFVRLM